MYTLQTPEVDEVETNPKSRFRASSLHNPGSHNLQSQINPKVQDIQFTGPVHVRYGKRLFPY